MSFIHICPEDHCLVCHGCFDRVSVPSWVADQLDFVIFQQSVEREHRERGCQEAAAQMERMAYRGNRLLEPLSIVFRRMGIA